MLNEHLTPDKFIDEQYDIDKYLTWPWALLLASLAIGFLTMTILESLKSNSRYRFSQREVADWLFGDYGYQGQDVHWLIALFRRWWFMLMRIVVWPRRRDMSNEMRYLILISTAGNKQALFSLPLENLCGQLSLGVQTLLDTGDAQPNLISSLIGQGFELPGVRDHYNLFMGLRNERNLPDDSQERFMEARSVISAMIQRNIDSFQILATYRWKRNQRDSAFFVSLIIASLGSILFASGRHPISWILVVLFLSYIGTFFAVFISDMVDLARRRADAL